jgi:hypothetical protein
MSGKKDLLGRKFGRWTVISFAGKRRISGDSRRFWKCRCDCGKEGELLSAALLSGKTLSCGCLKTERAITHGMTNTKTYRAWCSMMQRCYNQKNVRYGRYGGRGIVVCEEWGDFRNFYKDMGDKPSPDHSIDRINNDGNYEPGNCRWATRSEQQRNKGEINPINKLPRGDNHWTRKHREEARKRFIYNTRNQLKDGANNPNAKLNQSKADEMRHEFAVNPHLSMDELGMRFGVKRETARKVIKGLAWLS